MIEFLLEGHKREEVDNFGKVFDEYYPMLCAIAYTYTRSNTDAEELVGDVFYALWENRKKITISTSLKAYLIKAVKNRCLNFIRWHNAQERLKLGLTEKMNEIQKEYSLAEDCPFNILQNKENIERLNRAIDSLPDQCKAIFKLNRFEEKSYQEIADLLQISINTVKTQLRIAMGKMREIFDVG